MIEFNSGELMVNLVTLADFEDMVLDGIGFEISTYSQVWAISTHSRDIVTLKYTSDALDYIYFQCYLRVNLFRENVSRNPKKHFLEICGVLHPRGTANKINIHS